MFFQNLAAHVLVNLVYLILMFIGKTSRVSYINKKVRDEFEEKKIPIIYSFWHNRLIYLTYLYRKKYAGIMVSHHRDGDYIARVMKKCRLTAIRGSSTRGGSSALKGMIEYVKTGFDVAFTPDGPRGPKYSVKDGVFLAALKTGFPIVPICWNAKQKKIFNSWDNFIFPYPFNKFIVVYGEPIYIRFKKEIKKKSLLFKEEMMKCVDLADNYKW